MRKMIALVCLCFLSAVSTTAVAGKQQEKMSTCNKEAKEKSLADEERKEFMKSCLSKDGGAESDDKKSDMARAERKAARKENKEMCMKEAKEKTLAPEEHKTFMKSCMSEKGKAASAERKAARQEKKAACGTSADEKGLKESERRKFVRACMKE